MNLPEIPEIAIIKADSVEWDTTAERLAAAWPYLYAAALRHAADNADSEKYTSVEGLRQMADGAEREARP